MVCVCVWLVCEIKWLLNVCVVFFVLVHVLCVWI